MFKKLFVHGNVVNSYISYGSDTWSRDLNTDFTLGNCLFGAVKLTKTNDPDKYVHSGSGIGFIAHSQFLWSDSGKGKNFVIFEVGNVVYVDNRNKSILVLGEGPTEGLDDTTITEEAKFLIDFTALGERSVKKSAF